MGMRNKDEFDFELDSSKCVCSHNLVLPPSPATTVTKLPWFGQNTIRDTAQSACRGGCLVCTATFSSTTGFDARWRYGQLDSEYPYIVQTLGVVWPL
jgi:hypothetical protein